MDLSETRYRSYTCREIVNEKSCNQECPNPNALYEHKVKVHGFPSRKELATRHKQLQFKSNGNAHIFDEKETPTVKGTIKNENDGKIAVALSSAQKGEEDLPIEHDELDEEVKLLRKCHDAFTEAKTTRDADFRVLTWLIQRWGPDFYTLVETDENKN